MANITITGPISKKRRERNEKLLQKIDPLVDKILDRMDDTVGKTSFSQAAIGAGILIDKGRVLSGEAFQEEYALCSREDTIALSSLVDSLKAELARRKAEEIDVTPNKGKEPL